MNAFISRLVTGVALMIVALIVMLTGLGFLFAALYLSLARVIEPAVAALAVALAAFLTALILLLIARRSGRPRRRSLRVQPAVGAAPGAIEDSAAEFGMALAGEGRRLLKSHAISAAATALCAGLIVGISPRLRRALWRQLQ
jgi:hypothetical protein